MASFFFQGKKGLTQKEQIEVVRRFREGGYNTLVATCVGEEGLDIGEVDLVSVFANSAHIKIASPQAAQLSLQFFLEKSVVLHLREGPD